MLIELMIAFGFLNRARGSRLFNYCNSTVFTRLVATFGMGLCVLAASASYAAALWAWASLMLWCTPAWDKYWSEAIGNSQTHSRLYGLMQMTIRQLLILPCFFGLEYITGASYWLSLPALLLGLPYYLSGFLGSSYVITYAEYGVGAIIGLTIGVIL